MSLELLREKFGHSALTHEKKADNDDEDIYGLPGWSTDLPLNVKEPLVLKI
jgi:hypothetical protein